MAEFAKNLADRVEVTRRKNVDRDQRMKAVALIRTGHAEQVFKGIFPSDWPKPVIANFIDVVAKDTAEMVGVLPTLSAAGDSVLDESKRSKQDKLSRIINYLAYSSRLGTNLVTAADRMVTYGFVPLRVEANFDSQRPHIHVDECMGTYFEEDRWGELVSYSRVMRHRISTLIAMYPEHEALLSKDSSIAGTYYGVGKNDPTVDVIKWMDRDKTVLFVPQRDALVLSVTPNEIGRIPVSIAKLPSLDGEARGQFDDTLWVYAAKARLALLSLEATQKAVEAPIAVPQDVQDFAFGPDAILRSQSPERIRRVSLELPQSAMIENRTLDDELKFGARFPEARAGQVDGSVVTGRGVQALMGGFDQRIKVAQAMLGESISEALSIALEVDEKYWPTLKKDVHASVNGSPYELTYTPAKDINGKYTVTQEYGVMAGLDPNRALVWMLQALGPGLVSKSFVRRNLPVNMNVTEEEKVIDVEKLRDAAMMGAQQYAQAIPAMAEQGGDPVTVIKALASMIESRKKGVPIEKAIETAFQPPEPTPAEVAQGPIAPEAQPQGMGEAPGGGAPMPGGGGQPPGGQNMMQLLAQLGSSGKGSMSARTMRQSPI